MRTPVRVNFRGLPYSDEVERLCWKETQTLTRSYGRLTGCAIAITCTEDGGSASYGVRILLSLPRGDLAVRNEPGSDSDLIAAVRDGFLRARRQLAAATRRCPVHNL